MSLPTSGRRATAWGRRSTEASAREASGGQGCFSQKALEEDLGGSGGVEAGFRIRIALIIDHICIGTHVNPHM